MRSVSTRRTLIGGKRQGLRSVLAGMREKLNEGERGEAVAGLPQAGMDVLAVARQMISQRQRRYQYFSGHLFSDPAWDIMLELFVAEREKREVSVTNLCLTNVPDTTVLRWIKTLSFEGLVLRRKDKVDRRRVLVRLSRPAAQAMLGYIEEQMGGGRRSPADTRQNGASAEGSVRYPKPLGPQD